MSQLSLTNIINISVSAAQAGIGDYNTSNVGLFTRETPGGGFGSLGYKIYLDPSEVITDFGTASVTAAMANAAFSQKPNILGGNGYLAVVPFLTTGVAAVQDLAFSGVAASGAFVLNYAGQATASIAWNDAAATIQTQLRALPGLSLVTVSGSIAAGLSVTMTGVGGAVALLTVTADTLQTSAPAAITITVTTSVIGTLETLASAVTRTKDLVQYFGVMAAELQDATEIAAAAAVIQALNKIAFVVSRIAADVAPSGMLDLLRSGNLSQTRGLFYGSSTDMDALVMLASYVGRALSTNFSGNNTTQTMHLKDLIGVQPDSSMTQTILGQCQSAGADVYASFQGVPKVFTSGANQFFDDVYNQQWFVGALQVAGFNALAESSTKLAQTEDGVSILKGAYRQVCEQAVNNQYSAPGTWNNPTTFGNQGDFLRNISERGYYIFSSPVATQSSTDRKARKAPVIQIALKEAGALQKSDVIVFINA